MAVCKLKFTPEAVKDITQAAEYYEECQKGLGKRFRSEVKRKLVLVKEIPRIYTLRYGEVRFALIDIFPYSIHFSINEKGQVVQVHAVLCQFENPETSWKNFP
ncbi:type II toxin-antitoxin system RelE/ParE family toxin [Dyadobacter psychrophilus]|uniref:ParE toxin of type II toxin-antitoxin system, parDE n=1 Tax=Dyadobacter psychrophilus TaxID=651661 RepID=A0A1T5FV03_9BACT|nr:type II toxin-antitoxin system RelE/ParE family toxin [Dyadobacter psychrophilus]SKB99894.1 ParE toxin of type II toxin-antitoxin system, parDE [Dyadobacter psychrophilus]